MSTKPRIKLRRRGPVFQSKQWRCAGFASDMRYACGYGWTPQEAYYNWLSDLTVNY